MVEVLKPLARTNGVFSTEVAALETPRTVDLTNIFKCEVMYYDEKMIAGSADCICGAMNRTKKFQAVENLEWC